jgi:carbon-monoxide dehydrogenase medium subunit
MPFSERLAPTSLQEAVALCAKYKEKAKIMAGGTDLIVQVKQNKIDPDILISLENVRELNFISCEQNGINIGAMTPASVIERSQAIKNGCAVLSDAAAKLANPLIRRKATIGGNLCNGSPSADLAPALLVLGARLKIVGEKGERLVDIENFFVGPKQTALSAGEILARIIIPQTVPEARAVYLKSTRSGGADLSVVGVAVLTTMSGRTIKDIRIGLGAVAPTPMRAKETENLLRGKTVSEDALEAICVNTSSEACCISDVRCTADYRNKMIGILVKRAIRLTAGMASEEVPSVV